MFRRRRRSPENTTIAVHLGRTALAEIRGELQQRLRRGDDRVTVEIVGFDYFDANDLEALNAAVDDSNGRVVLSGLDRYVEAVAGGFMPPSIDLRDRVPRAVTLLGAVAGVTMVVDGRPLDDAECAMALQMANDSRRGIVTLDLLAVAELSAQQLLSVAELSGDLYRELRRLVLVNGNPMVGQQLRMAGLSGGLHMSICDTGWPSEPGPDERVSGGGAWGR